MIDSSLVMDDELYERLRRTQQLQRLARQQQLTEQHRIVQQQQQLPQQQQQQQQPLEIDKQKLLHNLQASRPSSNSRDYPVNRPGFPSPGIISEDDSLFEEGEEVGEREGQVRGRTVGVSRSVVPHGYNTSSPPGTPPWLDDIIRDIAVASAGKQIAIGSGCGLCSGYFIGKVGKAALMAVGGSLILLQVAHWQGLIQINWSNIEQTVSATKRNLSRQVTSNLPNVTNTARELFRRHVYLASSFGIGFLIGVAI